MQNFKSSLYNFRDDETTQRVVDSDRNPIFIELHSITKIPFMHLTKLYGSQLGGTIQQIKIEFDINTPSSFWNLFYWLSGKQAFDVHMLNYQWQTKSQTRFIW